MSGWRWIAECARGSGTTWRRRRRTAPLLTAGLLAVCGLPATPMEAAAAGRVALVIGNGTYESLDPLPNAVTDAATVGSALARLGFDVTTLGDGTRAEMLEGIHDFAVRSRRAEAALVFYSGYGLQAEGVDYLVPVNAKLAGDAEVAQRTVSLDAVLAATGPARVRIVILDACRSSPWPMLSGDLAGTGRPGGLVALATGPCRVAGVAGRRRSHSAYTAALLKQLETSNVEVGLLFRRAAAEAREAAGDTAAPPVLSATIVDLPEFYLSRSIDVKDRAGPMGRLATLLGRDLSTFRSDENGWTDLHYSAALGLPDLARRLLNAGTAVNARLHVDGEPLSDSVRQTLQAFGREPRVRRDGETALHVAARFDGRGVAAELLRSDAEMEAKDAFGQTPLHLAGQSNAGVTAAFLLERGAEIRAKDNSGDTPLHDAARSNARDAVEILVERGADMGARNNQGNTPLHSAASWNARAMAAFLLDRGADLHARNNRGETPLHVFWGNARETVELLLERGAAIDAKDNRGDTPLHSAAASTWSNRETVESLLDGGAEIDAKDDRGRTPLHDAARWGVPDTVKILLDHGAHVDARDDHGLTPLHAAAGSWRNTLPVVEILLDRGANLHARAGIGLTPLHYAARRNAREVAEALLNRGADVNAVDDAGRTPLMMIRADGAAEGDDVLRALLRRHGAD